jgi:hypothetical protein
MNSLVVSNTVENSKYHLESMTLRFQGAPTVRQAVWAAKSLSLGCSVKPDFDNPNLEVHMTPEGGLTKVQFYPNVKNTIRTTNLR